MSSSELFIAGIGAHVPATVPVDGGGWTGVAVAGELSAPEMAVIAARAALAGLDPSGIDIVLHAAFLHQGPDGWPAAQYIQRNTIGGTAPALEVRQACNGVLGAIDLARDYLARPGRSGALITGADNFGTPLVDRLRYLDGAETDRGSVFGDAGCALVLSRRGGFAEVRGVAAASLPEFEPMYRGDAALFPPACTVGAPMRMGARIAEFTARNPEFLPAARDLLRRTRVELAQRALAEAGITAAEVTRVTHVFAGAEGYLRGLLDPLGIDPARGLLDYGRSVGHLGVCDHVAGLRHLVDTGAVGPGDHVLMMGNGVGISLACVVLRMC
ncbi:ketoacyl-ACP synthase III family protein [Actinokineospora sp. NPDC004072]